MICTRCGSGGHKKAVCLTCVGELLSATITFRIHAKSHGHAISLASCSIKQWGVNIMDAKAVEVDI